jgi:PIN domain nuclease of toxin-antitoxin system
MRILLDTHCWLWVLEGPERFSTAARALLESRQNEYLLSAASAWEIAVKHALGRLRLPMAPAEFVQSRLELGRTTPLPIFHSHALRAGVLPAHHRDPFDRVLIAQAQIESLAIMTTDARFRAYDVQIIDT